MQIIILQKGRLWHSTFSLNLTAEQLCCTALTYYHHKQMMVQLLVCQQLLACSGVHKCTPYFYLMLKFYFWRCFSHIRFASLNASIWKNCSRRQCTHFLIVSWSSCHSLTRMIRVHQNSHCKRDSKWIWHVGQDFLLQIYSWSWVDGVRPILFL